MAGRSDTAGLHDERGASDTPPLEIETSSNPSASIIWLHGLGADGHDFEGIVPMLQLPQSLAVRFVFPHAPYRPVTINEGYVMRAWYDMALTEKGITQNAEHIHASMKVTHELIQREMARGIAGRRIVLAGFSQGGAIALHTGLRFPSRLVGIMALSALVPDVENLLAGIYPANAETPIFMAHGTDDPMIPFAWAQKARALMEERGLNIDWHEYRIGHAVISDEISDISRWLTRVFDGEQN